MLTHTLYIGTFTLGATLASPPLCIARFLLALILQPPLLILLSHHSSTARALQGAQTGTGDTAGLAVHKVFVTLLAALADLAALTIL